MSKYSLAPPPVVIVTGANGGVGFGICQRLLFQLCQLDPPDARPQVFASDVHMEERAPAGYKGVTLIMACRNKKRAEAARAKLWDWFQSQRDVLKKLPSYNEDYVSTFVANCNIQIHELDLASVKSVFAFSATIRQKYPYVSRLVCNAGVASFVGIDWPACFKQLALSPIDAITSPAYYRQYVGEISGDNLGWVWQSNVFGHFILFRELESMLAKSPENSRVIWCSSLEASFEFYDPEDWQLTKTEHSYEASKYQVDLIGTTLDQLALRSSKPTRHFVAEPGVCNTSISKALVTGFLDYVKLFAFYIARLYGSVHHPILPWNSAIAFVHLILVPLYFLPGLLSEDQSKPVRFGAETSRWGAQHVGVTPVKEWDSHKTQGTVLVKRCDELYESFKARANGGSPFLEGPGEKIVAV